MFDNSTSLSELLSNQQAQQTYTKQINEIRSDLLVGGTLFLIVPLSLAVGVFWYNKFRTYHHRAVVCRQREILEKMWQVSSFK